MIAAVFAVHVLMAATTPKGIKFNWKAAPGINSLPGCATGKRPCYRYTLTRDVTVIVAHPQPSMTSYIITPVKGTHVYSLQTDMIDSKGVVTSSKKNPKVTVKVQ
jgi:hypothetical protein